MNSEPTTATPPTERPGLLAELRRRGVTRAVMAYAVAAFAALQVAEPILHALKLPDGWLTGVVLLLAAGVPVVAAVSWGWDLTRRGWVRTEEAEPGEEARSGPAVASRGALAVVVVASAVLGAGLAWLALRPGAPAVVADADGRISVAVADFANQTGEAPLDALSGLLITSLEQSRKLKVLTRGRMLELLRQGGQGGAARIDEELARQVGVRAGVRALLLASIQRLGRDYVVELRAVDPVKDHYLFTLREQATDQAAILPLIDRLSERTRLELQERGAEVRASDIQVAAAITPNLEAYRHYFKGKELRSRLDDLGAEQEFRKGLEQEPGFALAQLEIALIARVWLTPGLELLEVAASRAAQLPEKERETVLAWNDLVQGRVAAAAARADRLAARYPSDGDVLNLAAWAAPEDAEKAAGFRRILDLVPDDSSARLFHLRFSIEGGAARTGLAEALAEERLRPTAGAATAVGVARLGTGDAVAAAADFRRALAAQDISWAKAGLYPALAVTDDLPSLRALAAGAPMGREGSVLALVDLREGRWRTAARRLEEVGRAEGALGADWFTLARITRAAAEERGSLPLPGWEGARLTRAAGLVRARDLDGAVLELGPVDPQACGPATWLLGVIESERGRHAEAVALLQRYEPCHLPGLSAFIRLLRLDDAELRIARGLAASGQHDEARRRAERLLARWRNADPDLPLLAEAKAVCRQVGCRAR